MEIYMVKNWEIKFRSRGEIRKEPNQVTRQSEPIPIKIEPVVSKNVNFTLEYIDCIKKKINPAFPVGSNHRGRNTSHHIAAFSTLSSSPETPGQIEISVPASSQACLFPLSVFDELCVHYGPENLSVSVCIDDFGHENLERIPNITAEGLPVERIQQHKLYRYGCVIKEVTFPDQFFIPWSLSNSNFTGHLTVKIALDHKVLTNLEFQRVGITPAVMSERGRAILESDVGKDFVIVASNGAKVKCHKSFLSASSEVFRTMMQTHMKEGTTNILKLADMSEAGVQAMLAHIYAWDIAEASKCCQVAVELYLAGHKYNMVNLEEAMAVLILSKPVEWFAVDSTVRLLVFVPTLRDDYVYKRILQVKVVDVLKWYRKTSMQLLLDSQEFQEAHKNPKTAMHVTLLLLSVSEVEAADNLDE